MSENSVMIAKSWCTIALAAAACAHQPPLGERLQVRVVDDEAVAVLAILESGENAAEADWLRLFSSEGYVRLKQREHAMQRSFTDSAFREFALSPELRARKNQLQRTLEQWKAVDAGNPARRALAYLPADAVLRARIYPVIKPQTNSFVFETATNPAIFLYLDPTVSPQKFDNILAHELHHIGYASVCTSERTGAVRYMGTFAEGRAMLAAAGSPTVHPHAVSEPAERAVWDRDYTSVGEDMARLERFFRDVAENRTAGSEARARWAEFVASDTVPQGAFYTVGYLMARTIELQFGRPRLLESTCDPIMFLSDYNSAARLSASDLPLWSDAFLERMRQ